MSRNKKEMIGIYGKNAAAGVGFAAVGVGIGLTWPVIYGLGGAVILGRTVKNVMEAKEDNKEDNN